MTLITVTNLVLNFASACRSLVPALERADVAWQDETQWDNWDRIAEPMFENLVTEQCVYAAVGEENIHTLSVAGYGFVPDGRVYNAWIALDGEPDTRMIGLSTELQPFDRVELIDRDHRFSIALDSASFAFNFRAPNLSEQQITIIDLAAQ